MSSIVGRSIRLVGERTYISPTLPASHPCFYASLIHRLLPSSNNRLPQSAFLHSGREPTFSSCVMSSQYRTALSRVIDSSFVQIPPALHLTNFVRHFSHSSVCFDHYRTLGVRRDASPREIKNAYYQLCLMFHPDRQPKATKLNRGNIINSYYSMDEYYRISLAYEVLSNPEQRVAYDERRSKNQSIFGKWRDQYEDYRYRQMMKDRMRHEEEEETEEDKAWREEMEKERQRREKDPHALELVLGSKKLSLTIYGWAIFFVCFAIHHFLIRGNVFSK